MVKLFDLLFLILYNKKELYFLKYNKKFNLRSQFVNVFLQLSSEFQQCYRTSLNKHCSKISN